jgi:hypothetical protein
MDSASLPPKDKEALKGKTKDELIEIVLKLQKLTANHDYVYIDAVARQGSHVGLPMRRP